MDHDILHLGEFQFRVLIDKATLHALISNATDFQLYWMINIPCDAADVAIDGETHFWRPRVYFESMTFPYHNWKQLEGQHYLSPASAAGSRAPPPCRSTFQVQTDPVRLLNPTDQSRGDTINSFFRWTAISAG